MELVRIEPSYVTISSNGNSGFHSSGGGELSPTISKQNDMPRNKNSACAMSYQEISWFGLLMGI